ncbi:isopentenyl-diphosphate Delta-isomerase 1-like [Galendromus occidentalis]|uniref:isopentenyl-diphosphate Delta-isomerase n=1 Tax=Galendromus occidentalis TaxID=34638 RepID=A0AAJ6QSI3_9ACAR|nr:isopentenyl-diphosphate Delta-isomerase 1-like [Galendromus occidentalis]
MGSKRSARSATSSQAAESPLLDSFDAEQVKLLDEECIQVDENDRVIGSSSKKDCHLMANINRGLLHRAFSVFFFNSSGELLVQQRSDRKITFPGCYTNSCCSHPLANSSELTADPILGVKRAAQRRMFVELGIPPKELPLEAFNYLTRILYKASSDGTWGEHEIDYILFVRKDLERIEANQNEVKSLRFIRRDQIDDFVDNLAAEGHSLTPWFKLILNTFLKKWWDNLDCLHLFESHDVIHRLC